MNCEQAQQRLDDYLDAELDLKQEAELHAHLDHCQVCREQLQQAEALQASLKALPVPEMTPGFARRAVDQAAGRLHQPRHHRSAFVAGFGSAMVAGVAMLLVVGGFLPGGTATPSSPLQEVAISVSAPQTVNLAFDVSHAIQDATLSIQLPDNVELVGFPGKHRLTWQTSLTQGRNILPLPLQGSAQSNGELITATIKHDGKQKSVRIRVKVKAPLQPQAGANTLNWV
jgi:hypothetical protein